MLSNEHLDVEIGVDTAEKEPSKVLSFFSNFHTKQRFNFHMVFPPEVRRSPPASMRGWRLFRRRRWSWFRALWPGRRRHWYDFLRRTDVQVLFQLVSHFSFSFCIFAGVWLSRSFRLNFLDGFSLAFSHFRFQKCKGLLQCKSCKSRKFRNNAEDL